MEFEVRVEGRERVVIDDMDLIERASLGDRDAFDQLVTLFGPRLHGYARRMLADEWNAQEVVQDSLLAAWLGLNSFRRDSSVRTWLFAICSRKIVDSYRLRLPIPVGDDSLNRNGHSTVGLPFPEVSSTVFVEAVEQCLATLPPRQRAAWMLREGERMPFTEVGKVLGLAPGAARGAYASAREQLRKSMEAWR